MAVERHLTAIAAAAERETSHARRSRELGSSSSREREAAIAAAAANRLGRQAIGAIALRPDIVIAGDGHGSGAAAACAKAANGGAERRPFRRKGHRAGKSAIAAAATQRLRENAIGISARRSDSPGARRRRAGFAKAERIDGDAISDAANRAPAANRNAQATFAQRQRAAQTETAIAAAAADGLRQNAVGIIA